MRRRVSAIATVGCVALAAVGCGLGFADIELLEGEAKPNPTATGTGTTTPTTTTTTDPLDPDAAIDASLPDGAMLDTSLPEVKPPPTTASPQELFRFNVNYYCNFFSEPTCTQNDGTFRRPARFTGNAEADYTISRFVPIARLDAKGGAVDLDMTTDLVPTGAPTKKLTIAAWVKRANDARSLARIFSFANDRNNDKPVFELGYVNEADTKLVFSLDDSLEAGGAKMSADTALLGQDEWTFIAVTYDQDAASPAEELCFYRGVTTGSDPGVAALQCVDYPGKVVRRPGSAPKLAIGHAARPQERAMPKSFPGRIDNAYVFVGDVLALSELQKIFAEGHD